MSIANESMLGPFRLLRPLGRGSMGVVHLAQDTATGRHVAVKSLALGHEFSAEGYNEARARFLAEAVTGQRLTHPDIVAVLAAGEHEGTLWLAMELLGGCELGRYTRMPRLLPEALVLQIAERLARALAHAHDQGVVHRDIKPGNVMLDLPAGSVKLTDFGIAGLADMSRTRTGVVLGTPVYMAPEQLAGAAADARSDLYSLGVLLFHLLTGRLPHEHSSLGELLRRVAREPAPDVRSLKPQLSPQAAALVAQALSKQPAGRYDTAGHMAEALASARGALEPVHAPGPAAARGAP